MIHQYANGIDNDPVAEKEPVNKGYGNSITLSRDISDYETGCQVLLSLCETVGARLRQTMYSAAVYVWNFGTGPLKTSPIR